MAQTEGIKAFFLRKRKLRLVLLGVAIVLLGAFLDKHAEKLGGLARSGAELTRSIHSQLAAEQPGEILDRYRAAMNGPATCSDCGPKNPVSYAIAFVKATPSVAGATWQEGRWFSRIALVAAIAFMIMLVIGIAMDKTIDGLQRVIAMCTPLIFGPPIIGLVFWLMLKLLILLTWAIGEVLSGVALLATALASVWKIATMAIDALKHADEMEEKGVPFLKKMFGAHTAPAAASSGPAPVAAPAEPPQTPPSPPPA